MTHLLRQHDMFEPCTRPGPKHASLPLEFSKFRRGTDVRAEAEHVAVGKIEYAELRLAEALCVRENGLEYRLQLALRARDDP